VPDALDIQVKIRRSAEVAAIATLETVTTTMKFYQKVSGLVLHPGDIGNDF
jgi:hypothetical protein